MAAGPTRTRELDASSFAPRMRTTFAQIAKDAGTSIKAVSGALRGGLTRTTEAYYARICAVDASRRWSERSSAPRHGSKRGRSASDRYRRNLHRPTDWNAVVRIRSNHRRCPHFGMSVLGMRAWSGVPRSPQARPRGRGTFHFWTALLDVESSRSTTHFRSVSFGFSSRYHPGIGGVLSAGVVGVRLALFVAARETRIRSRACPLPCRGIREEPSPVSSGPCAGGSLPG